MAISFKSLNLGDIVLMDGGMGSILEDEFDQHIRGKPLWSAEVLLHAPQTIVQAHTAFLRAGAQLIKTVTYQCGPITFEQAGMTSEDATELLYEAVRLADEARDTVNPDAVLALSLGPYGAQFGQEYNGYYPVPFGPGGDHTNAFAPYEGDKEQGARDALARFHYERLLVYASKSDIWDKIDCLAFETVPLLREAQVIQKAITMLETYLMGAQKKMKPWWLSFVFLNGQFPQDSRPNGRKLTVKELVRNLCSPIGDGTIPSGIGVNCTGPKDSVHLLKSLSQEFLQYSIPQPWLVLYPNARGQGYDPTDHSCMDQGNDETEEELKDKWVAEVGGFRQLDETNSRGLLVGGCCKCGSAYINGLKSLVLRLRTPSNSSD